MVHVKPFPHWTRTVYCKPLQMTLFQVTLCDVQGHFAYCRLLQFLGAVALVHYLQ